MFGGKNVYKANDIDSFEEKMKGILEKKLPDLTEEGYKVAKERDIKNIGAELKKIYESLLEKVNVNCLYEKN